MTVAETRREPVLGEPGQETLGAEPEEREVTEAEPGELVRYTFFERLVHWVVAITFVALLLSGLALAYPRMAWLSGLFGGGQTMRAAHPWIGVVFTAGLLVMLVMWGRGMWLDRADWAWFRRLGEYSRRGHVEIDSGRWNGGQKGYYWASFVAAIIMLLTGIVLWFPSIAETGTRQLSRLSHLAVFLFMVGGFIIHVLLSVFLFTGTMAGMTSGRVTRSWAAWHHPRWYREQVGAERAAAERAERHRRLAAEEARAAAGTDIPGRQGAEPAAPEAAPAADRPQAEGAVQEAETPAQAEAEARDEGDDRRPDAGP